MVGVLGLTVLAEARNHGVVNLNGRIVEAACAIDTDSLSQTVEMGVLPVSAMKQQGRGPVRPFVIRLIDCVLVSPGGQNRQTFTVTFDGASVTNNASAFSVSGDARGIALTLQSAAGQVIYPGKPTARQPVVPGQSELHYQLQLVPNTEPFSPGGYHSALRFKLDYD